MIALLKIPLFNLGVPNLHDKDRLEIPLFDLHNWGSVEMYVRRVASKIE